MPEVEFTLSTFVDSFINWRGTLPAKEFLRLVEKWKGEPHEQLITMERIVRPDGGHGYIVAMAIRLSGDRGEVAWLKYGGEAQPVPNESLQALELTATELHRLRGGLQLLARSPIGARPYCTDWESPDSRNVSFVTVAEETRFWQFVHDYRYFVDDDGSTNWVEGAPVYTDRQLAGRFVGILLEIR